VYLLFMSEMKDRPISSLEKVYMVLSFSGVLALIATALLKPMGLGLKALASSGPRK